MTSSRPALSAGHTVGKPKRPRPSRMWDWNLLILCNLMWASQYTFVRIVQTQMGPEFATFFPVTAATLLLIPIVRFNRNRSGKVLNRGPMARSDIRAFLVLGICGQLPAQLFITWGVGWSLASNAALMALALPILTAVMAYFMIGERMTPVRWISFALAIAGSVECAGVNWKDVDLTHPRFIIGNLLIFLGILGSAFYNVYSKTLLGRYSPLEVQLYSYYVLFACILPITLGVEPQSFRNMAHFSASVWIGLIELTLFVYLLSMVIFLRVLSRMDATQAGLSNYLIPFFGLILAWLVLHEKLTAFMIAGGILVLASTLLITVFEPAEMPQNPDSAQTP